MMKDTQNKWVLSQLQNGVIEYGIQDLPKRISELRRQGYPIESQRVNGLNRNGLQTHWNLYWLAS